VITEPQHPAAQDERVSDQLERWLEAEGGDTTLGGLIAAFEEKSFALLFILLFILLLGVSALPIPTGGATHVFDVIAVLVAAQLVAGRDQIWIPKRWVGLQLAGSKQQKFIRGLLKFIRICEKVSRPRFRFLFDHRLSNVAFGLSVILFTIAAFIAPPFSGLDTLPALGVVVLSLGVLLEDFAIVAIGVAIGVGGIVLEFVLGKAAFSTFKHFF
jgi:hypothetical protein